MSEGLKYTVGSGNVFRDLGLPDAEELKAKAALAYEISMIIEERGLKQAEAAEILGVDQPKVSALVRGRLEGFSMERLYRFLNALGRDVQIVVQPKPRGRKTATLTVIRNVPTHGPMRRHAKT
ncbi:MAG: helix-turn-helix transcriptional regulator [Bacillota bacterium]|nr:helix-turn-helix transcriptional regulator [Bacillota bacterium]